MTSHRLQIGRKAERSIAENARQCLSGGGVLREDSDDELGLEDHPWEWIYSVDGASNTLYNTSTSTAGSALTPIDGSGVLPSRTVSHTQRGLRPKGRIVGARMGSFECKIGDCVFLKAEGTNEAWVGLICEFCEEEEDDGKAANFMWFSSAKEIRNKAKKRTDSMEVT